MDTVLTLNVGSATVKVGLFQAKAGAAPIECWRDIIDLVDGQPRWRSSAPPPAIIATRSIAPAEQIVSALASRLQDSQPSAIAHRFVHGGESLHASARIDEVLLDTLQALAPLAPLHQPPALALARAAGMHWPGVFQVAAFDTAFHRTLPPLTRRLPIPADWDALGVRRYGFHGLSYESAIDRLRREAPDLAEGRLVIAHLGSGSSLCAIHMGCSVDTTMGFSALDGVPMATRPGSLDPGVLAYLLRNTGWSVDQLEDFLYHECGLKALSGSSADMASLLRDNSPCALFAVNYFAHRIAQAVATLAVTLGGIDGLVFTGGIGEHAAALRAAVAERLFWIGLTLDETANARHAASIAGADSLIAVRVVPADEERILALDALRLLRNDTGTPDRT